MTQRYYLVEAKCGHVGKGKCIVKEFPVQAFSKSDAAETVRYMPRVKHDQKYAIRSVVEIDYETFIQLREIYENDPYMNCKSIQDQRFICGSMLDLIQEDEECRNRYKRFDYDKQERRERVAYKKLKEYYKHEYREMY